MTTEAVEDYNFRDAFSDLLYDDVERNPSDDLKRVIDILGCATMAIAMETDNILFDTDDSADKFGSAMNDAFVAVQLAEAKIKDAIKALEPAKGEAPS